MTSRENFYPQEAGVQYSTPVVVTSSRLLEFDEKGVPHVVSKQLDTVNRQLVDRINFSAMLLPYKIPQGSEEDPEEAKFEGFSNLEVAAIRLAGRAADGDKDAYKFLIERVAGKAVEKNLNISTNVSYTDFLANLAKSQGGGAADIDNLVELL